MIVIRIACLLRLRCDKIGFWSSFCGKREVALFELVNMEGESGELFLILVNWKSDLFVHRLQLLWIMTLFIGRNASSPGFHNTACTQSPPRILSAARSFSLRCNPEIHVKQIDNIVATTTMSQEIDLTLSLKCVEFNGDACVVTQCC